MAKNKETEKDYLVEFYYSQEVVRVGQVVIRAKSKEEAERIANEKDYNDEFDDIIDEPEVIGSDFVIESITPLSYVEETK